MSSRKFELGNWEIQKKREKNCGINCITRRSYE